jgi:hypothetical protein
MPPDARAADDLQPWHLAAAAAAWLLPGLGHYLLGERRRGSILACTIGVLWLAGLLIGGPTVLDLKNAGANIVQYGQVGMAPSFMGYYVHSRLRVAAADHPEDGGYEPSFAAVQEQGVLFTAIAGMLNVLAVFDVLYRDPRRTLQRQVLDGQAGAPHEGAWS